MANEVLQKVGTQLSFADHAGDFGPTAANVIEVGTPTNVDLALTTLAADTYVNSDQFDFGATRAAQFSVIAAIEWSVAPTAGTTVEFWLAPSPSSGATIGNTGGTDGVDGAYTGYSGAAEGVAQLMPLGVLVASNDAVVQIAYIGKFSPPERFAQLVVRNNTDQSFNADDVEMNVVITPIIDEVQ